MREQGGANFERLIKSLAYNLPADSPGFVLVIILKKEIEPLISPTVTKIADERGAFFKTTFIVDLFRVF